MRWWGRLLCRLGWHALCFDDGKDFYDSDLRHGKEVWCVRPGCWYWFVHQAGPDTVKGRQQIIAAKKAGVAPGTLSLVEPAGTLSLTDGGADDQSR